MQGNAWFILTFLAEMERLIPPPSGHHSFTRVQYGSDEKGWKDELALNIRTETGQATLFLDGMDLEGDPYFRARWVVAQMTNPMTVSPMDGGR
jgi:hypothetical protein